MPNLQYYLIIEKQLINSNVFTHFKSNIISFFFSSLYYDLAV